VDWLKQNWIVVTVVALVVFIGWSTMRKKSKLGSDSINVNMSCPKCGWMGIVSKYATACRKCGNKNMKKV
jgi:hypothetical protein